MLHEKFPIAVNAIRSMIPGANGIEDYIELVSTNGMLEISYEFYCGYVECIFPADDEFPEFPRITVRCSLLDRVMSVLKEDIHIMGVDSETIIFKSPRGKVSAKAINLSKMVEEWPSSIQGVIPTPLDPVGIVEIASTARKFRQGEVDTFQPFILWDSHGMSKMDNLAGFVDLRYPLISENEKQPSHLWVSPHHLGAYLRIVANPTEDIRFDVMWDDTTMIWHSVDIGVEANMWLHHKNYPYRPYYNHYVAEENKTCTFAMRIDAGEWLEAVKNIVTVSGKPGIITLKESSTDHGDFLKLSVNKGKFEAEMTSDIPITITSGSLGMKSAFSSSLISALSPLAKFGEVEVIVYDETSFICKSGDDTLITFSGLLA